MKFEHRSRKLVSTKYLAKTYPLYRDAYINDNDERDVCDDMVHNKLCVQSIGNA